MSLNLPYYYGHSGEQYAFSRIPKLLLTDERFADLSTDAKLLYGLLLDRMELSYCGYCEWKRTDYGDAKRELW